ncbi:MAG: fructosamine kinase family protein [Flavobacteriales bacterium]|nr:fructosamine kinase family protein [Flavobacteriales bacterium]
MVSDYLELQNAIQEELKKKKDPSIQVIELSRLGGGSINTAMSIKTNQGNFFVKFNDAAAYPDLFTQEAKNLELLRNTRTLHIPQVYSVFEYEGTSMLLMEFIEAGTPHYDFWRDFGIGLARIHKHTQPTFGLNYDNYIGSLKQINTPKTNWVEFFIECRLNPMLKLAVDNGKADEQLVKKFEALYLRLDEIFPQEAPALLHGDLWSGNCMADMDGDPVIYDPAVYYGHREMDLAMSSLFGGFEEAFYEAYNEEFPLEKNWQQRLSICNLYPLLVHVNLFVGSYIQSVKNIVSRF